MSCLYCWFFLYRFSIVSLLFVPNICRFGMRDYSFSVSFLGVSSLMSYHHCYVSGFTIFFFKERLVIIAFYWFSFFLVCFLVFMVLC